MYMMYFEKCDRFVWILEGVLVDMGVGFSKIGVEIVDGVDVYTVYLDGFDYDRYVGIGIVDEICRRLGVSRKNIKVVKWWIIEILLLGSVMSLLGIVRVLGFVGVENLSLLGSWVIRMSLMCCITCFILGSWLMLVRSLS